MTKVENMQNTARMLEKRSQMMLESAKADGTVSAAEEKFIELLKHESFAQEFVSCASLEAAKELLEKNAVDLSMDELQSIQTAAVTILAKIDENNGELSEEDLEQVAGGWSWKSFGYGLLLGAAIAAVALAVVVITVGSCGTGTAAAVVGAGAAIGGIVGGLVGD